MDTPTTAAATAHRPQMKEFGQLFSEAWGLFKKHRKRLLGIALPPVLAIALFDALPTENTTTKTVVWIFIVILYFVNLWAQQSVINALLKGPETLTVTGAYQATKKNYWRFVLLTVFVALIVLGGSVLLIVPGIVVGVTLMFAPYLFLSEGLPIREAMHRAQALIAGYWSDVFWRSLFFGIILAIVSMVVTFLLGFLLSPLGFVVTQSVTTLVTAIVSVLGICFSYLLFDNVRQLKAGQPLVAPTGFFSKFNLLAVIGVLGGGFWIGWAIFLFLTGLAK